jgi:hypothetical protein
VPAVIPAHIALRSRLRDSAARAVSLNERLEVLITVKQRAPGGFHGKIDHSQPPWSAPAANAIMDLHAQSREMEAWLRLSQGLPLRPRGGSGENTRRALEAVVRLSEAAPDAAVRDHSRWLDGWARRALIAMGLTEMPRRLPVTPGCPEPACPFCGHHTLRALPLKGKIFCIDPGCADADGRRPEARMEFSRVTGDCELIWQDRVVGLPS